MEKITQPVRQAGHHQGGFTLVEVMVALLVLGIGLLGIAKLMLFASRANDSAYLRSQATELAYEILDDMRANRQMAMTQGYDTPSSAPATYPGITCLGATTCPPSAQALYDVYEWKLRLATPTGALPSGKGSVVTSSTTPTTAVITVQWDDTAAQSSFGGCPSPPCKPITVTLETVL